MSIKFNDLKVGHFYKPRRGIYSDPNHRTNCIYSFYDDSVVYMIGETVIAVGNTNLWGIDFHNEIKSYLFKEITIDGSKIIPIVFSPKMIIYAT